MPLFVYHEVEGRSDGPGEPFTHHLIFFTQPTLDRVKYLLSEEFEAWLWNHEPLSRFIDHVGQKVHDWRCKDNCGIAAKREPKGDGFTEWEKFVTCTYHPISIRIELGSHYRSRRNRVEVAELELDSATDEKLTAARRSGYARKDKS